MSVGAAEARRIERPAWVNGRTLLGALLFVAALVLGQQIMRSAEATIPVWTAARDLPADKVISAADLRAVEVQLPGDIVSGYALQSTHLVGSTVTRSVSAGELIPLAGVSSAGSGPGRVITIPVTTDHGVGGALRPGDRVDVFATFDATGPNARTVLVAGAVEVVEVLSGGGLVMSDPMMTGISIAVDPGTAADVAFAIQVGAVDIAKVTRADAPGVTSPVSLGDVAP